MSFDHIPAMLADLLQESRTTNERLAAVSAGLAAALAHAYEIKAEKDAGRSISATAMATLAAPYGTPPEKLRGTSPAAADKPHPTHDDGAPAPAKKPVNDARGLVTAKAAEDVAPAKTVAEPTPIAESVAAPAPPSTAAIEYDAVAKAINEVVKTNRERAVAALAKFGAKRGTELKPEQYADFLKELG